MSWGSPSLDERAGNSARTAFPRIVAVALLTLISLWTSAQHMSPTIAATSASQAASARPQAREEDLPSTEGRGSVTQCRGNSSIDLYAKFDGDSAPGDGELDNIRVVDVADCADACERYNAAPAVVGPEGDVLEVPLCHGFVVVPPEPPHRFYRCFLKSLPHAPVKADKRTSYFRRSPPSTTAKRNATDLTPAAVRETSSTELLFDAKALLTTAYESFECDSSPNEGDLDDFRVTDVALCAEACEGYNVGLRGQFVPSTNLTCHGFVSLPRQGPLELTHCFLKGVPHSTGYRNCDAVSYFRKLPKGFMSGNNLSVVFGVLSAGHLLRPRLLAQLLTFLNKQTSAIFLEEKSRNDWRALYRNYTKLVDSIPTKGEFLEEPTEGDLKSRNGAWKNLPILKRMHELHPTADWLAIIDDDTYVSVENLRTSLATFHADLDRPVGVGTLMRYNEVFLQGGAGILLNRRAREAMLANYEACLLSCRQWAGDIRLGCCASMSGVSLRRDQGFWWQPVAPSIGRDRRPEVALFPISFHEMREAQWVHDLHSAFGALAKRSSCDGEAYNGTEMCRRRAAGQPNVPVTWDALKLFYEKVFADDYTPAQYEGSWIPRHDKYY